MTIKPDLPKREEIWLVNFDPTVGAEIKKVRPAIENVSIRLKKRNPTPPMVTFCWVSLRQPNLQ